MNPYRQYPYGMSYNHPQFAGDFPQYPEAEMWAKPMVKQPFYPHLKSEVIKKISPFVKYGLEEAKDTSNMHVLQEVAAMAYLIGKGMNPHTAYLTVESWEINEMF
ncbi:hypothetical protein [Bacillus sp. CECT 9360]|uniref:hypothetical protein n=1 Tax=Bacillus sp. CECT 9360 TaxID=2845821 RepID=UPI001E551459|nr:hypothetical protein [Bacillus sp. CECT 9360]CAH0343819.1 hypothetical protein BCI9360_00044 [Bacillus sp. CECT 9360]